jgi:hypothetical protein
MALSTASQRNKSAAAAAAAAEPHPTSHRSSPAVQPSSIIHTKKRAKTKERDKEKGKGPKRKIPPTRLTRIPSATQAVPTSTVNIRRATIAQTIDHGHILSRDHMSAAVGQR